jgi:hypothetical protein
MITKQKLTNMQTQKKPAGMLLPCPLLPKLSCVEQDSYSKEKRENRSHLPIESTTKQKPKTIHA